MQVGEGSGHLGMDLILVAAKVKILDRDGLWHALAIVEALLDHYALALALKLHILAVKGCDVTCGAELGDTLITVQIVYGNLNFLRSHQRDVKVKRILLASGDVGMARAIFVSCIEDAV
eukprot:CAMPEP_0115828720 /NCGR_PEP_ID=MMETSP0287-20121206/721_1 /TAXON_ID=412157 /ORGANISM="Chrysochromulina rotalis, Strain UIO044" /LENGTH=118 /DNA_ID=CAMNT_0003281949 /DNA_START=225 /DNA_END=581 /DNA_ORIENTATION=-